MIIYVRQCFRFGWVFVLLQFQDFFSNDVHDYNPFLHLWSLGVEEQFLGLLRFGRLWSGGGEMKTLETRIYLKKIKHGTRSSPGSIWWRRGFSMAVWKLCKEAHLSVYAAIASICFFLTIKRTKRHMWTGRCCIFRIPACNDTIESGRRWRQYLGFPHPVRGKHHVWMVDRSGQRHVFRCLSPLEIERFWKRLGRTFGSLMQSQSIAMLWIFIVIYSYHVDMYKYHEKA